VAKSALEVGTRVVAEDLALAALRAGAEGGIVGLGSAPIDMALNQKFREDGMNATEAGGLSGATSVVAASAGMYAASSAAASLAAGEMTLGPEMAPFAATTAAFAGVAAAQGSLLGFAEDHDRRIAEHNAEVDYYDNLEETYDRDHDVVEEQIASRSQQLHAEAIRESENRLKQQQVELRELLETARDSPQELSQRDLDNVAQMRDLYNQGLLSEGTREVIQKHDENFWSDTPTHTADQFQRHPDLPPAADFSDLAVGADESTVVEHEGS